MFRLRMLLVAVLLCLLACSASAECYYNGTPHPEGTVIGPYVCKNGQWVDRQGEE